MSSVVVSEATGETYLAYQNALRERIAAVDGDQIRRQLDVELAGRELLRAIEVDIRSQMTVEWLEQGKAVRRPPIVLVDHPLAWRVRARPMAGDFLMIGGVLVMIIVGLSLLVAVQGV